MGMTARIQKWGNSQGIRFPRDVLRRVRIAVGDEVELEVHDREIIVKPARPVRGKYRLRDVLPKKPSKTGEVEWGKPAGKEVW